MQSSTAYSDSESDDEAPEEVALTSAKRSTKEAAKKTKDLEAKAAAARKAKNKAADTKHKAGKAKKAKVVEEEEVAFEDEELDLFSGSEEEEEDELDSEEEEAPAASSSTYLDPALFASAAKHFEPEQQPKAGKGKHAMKRMVRAEKKARAIAARERAEEIGVGGERRVGDLTVQHLPSPSHLPSSLSRTALPSHTSATKFLTDRLYSKKRVIAVLDSSKRPVDDSGRKRRKKVGGGMSEESKALLGMGMDDGSKEKLNAETAQEREKGRKKSLLLQAQGTRKSATLARPLKSARGKAAANFAVSMRTK